VIATDHGGPREIIENGVSGFLTAPSDSDGLARCLLELISSPDLRRTIGRQALQRINTKFTTNQAVLEFEQVYSAVLDTPRSRS
jgi:glycosyltransferase involved in cell wall biosynthesis